MSSEALEPHVRKPQEDLFDFDDLLLGSFPALERKPGDEPAPVLPERKKTSSRHSLTAPMAPPREAPPLAEAAPAPPPVAPPPIVVQAPVAMPPTIVVQQTPQSQRGQLALVGAFVFVSLCFAGVCWRALSTLQTFVADSGSDASAPELVLPASVESALPNVAAAAPAPPLEELAEPPLQALTAGAALALAHEALEQGRFDLARQRAFGVLAAIDRYDVAMRADLEARASFLLGDCWSREAESAARAHSTAGSAIQASEGTWQ